MKQKFKILFFILLFTVVDIYPQYKVDELIDSLTIVESDEKSISLALKIAAELKYEDWNRAEHYIKLAKETAEEAASPKIEAGFYKMTGKIYYDRELFDLALQYNLKAYDFYKDNFPRERYEIENLLAVIHARLYNEEKALYYFKRVYEYYSKNNYEKLAPISNNIGSLYLDSKRPDSALYYLKQSELSTRQKI